MEMFCPICLRVEIGMPACPTCSQFLNPVESQPDQSVLRTDEHGATYWTIGPDVRRFPTQSAILGFLASQLARPPII